MIVDGVRQTAVWLADATTGVNALRSSVPRDSGEAAPPAVSIYDETRSAWVARGVVPRGKTGSGALILVRGADETDVPLFPGEGGGFTPLGVRIAYVRRADVSLVESDDAVRDALQTLRICARSIASQWLSQQAMPTRNQVDFDRPLFKIVRSAEELAGDDLILAEAHITYPAVDTWAMAATS